MEKTLDLKMPGVIELGREELIETDGWGIPALLGAGLLVAATWEVIMEGSGKCWEDFKRGYQSTQ